LTGVGENPHPVPFFRRPGSGAGGKKGSALTLVNSCKYGASLDAFRRQPEEVGASRKAAAGGEMRV
jgi:hypothetical protein